MANKISPKLSPMMEHYLMTKENNKDSILFYRLGDFYEMFYEDAITVSKELDLTLTGKSCGLEQKAPMCGVPYHAAQTYVAKLLEKGYKVAICEQGEVIPGTRVERNVTQIVTPGTVLDSEMLEANKNNYLLSIYKNKDILGVSYIDISTGDFDTIQISGSFESGLSDVLSRIMPSEVIANLEGKELYDSLKVLRLGILPRCNSYFEWAFSYDRANENLTAQLGENYQNVFELNKKKEFICSAGAILEYVKETQKRALASINRIKVLKNNNFMQLDMNSRRNLELVESIRERKKPGSLLGIIDKTLTPMGARRMRKMFDEPLQDAKEINLRLEGVEELVKKIIIRGRLHEVLGNVKDVERFASRLAYGNIMPRELVTLKDSLKALPLVKEILSKAESKKLQSVRDNLIDFTQLVDMLDKAFVEENIPQVLKDGGYIKFGFNTQLDELRNAKSQGKDWIKELELKEREETGIKNLKIDSNSIFGYFIEVNKSLSEFVPLRYIRKQTISNNERYITEELKVLEDKIFGSEEKAVKLEGQLLGEIKGYLQQFIIPLQKVSSAVAELDAILSFAIVSANNNYVKPVVNNSLKHIKIVDGRHPVVEAYLKNGAFIANDTFLNEESDQTMVITGPNMAGKSTYMRQVAIITFLAHIGCFVPAKEAEVCITDRIFTRVGASDDLVFGQSTFMVEMSEVAQILANATDKSLILLDEIGRGTSTFDGLSIAWAVVEFISNNYKSKTLFATHYHELTELEGVIEGVKNYKIAVKEIDDNVVFLRKIVRGGANRSFGIEVARLAGVPKAVLERAKEISYNLEQVNTKLDLNIFKDKKVQAMQNNKKALEILTRLKDIDVNRISPMHAFDLLNDLVSQAKEGGE